MMPEELGSAHAPLFSVVCYGRLSRSRAILAAAYRVISLNRQEQLSALVQHVLYGIVLPAKVRPPSGSVDGVHHSLNATPPQMPAPYQDRAQCALSSRLEHLGRP